MNTIINIICLTAAGIAHAAPAEKARTYSFRREKIEFVEIADESLLVSKDCRKKEGKTDCEATKGLATLSSRQIFRENPGTEGEGSLLCETQLKGKVVIGLSEIGDENAFCRFVKDGSLVDLGSLIHRARQNDEAAAAKEKTPATTAPAKPARRK